MPLESAVLAGTREVKEDAAHTEFCMSSLHKMSWFILFLFPKDEHGGPALNLSRK
jgi:hypothetical protein